MATIPSNLIYSLPPHGGQHTAPSYRDGWHWLTAWRQNRKAGEGASKFSQFLYKIALFGGRILDGAAAACPLFPLRHQSHGTLQGFASLLRVGRQRADTYREGQ